MASLAIAPPHQPRSSRAAMGRWSEGSVSDGSGVRSSSSGSRSGRARSAREWKRKSIALALPFALQVGWCHPS